ncbi:hypothetical protein WMF27_25060 [Sorangium sp. So ce281]|uniref:hypothetical protein n=1 Tax=unclassified Sorangium TaxID=2621164 RepID=UPI003F60A6A5
MSAVHFVLAVIASLTSTGEEQSALTSPPPPPPPPLPPSPPPSPPLAELLADEVLVEDGEIESSSPHAANAATDSAEAQTKPNLNVRNLFYLLPQHGACRKTRDERRVTIAWQVLSS